MVSSLMQTSSMALANRAPFTSRPVPCRAVAPQRTRVVAAASQEDKDWKPEQAPSKAIMRAVGALAAAQLVFLPAAGAGGIKDLLPDTVTSGAAREAANERTSDAPSFRDVGDSLKTTLGTSSDPKDIGRAIDNNTPDGPDLTKNPKDLADDAKAGANKLFNKVQNAAPDLSAVNEPLTDSTGLPNPFDKGSGGIPRASDITELAARAKKEAGASLGGDVAKNAPDAGDVKNAGANVADKAKGAVSKVQSAVGDNAGLPSPQEAADKLKGKVDEVGRNVQGAGSNNPLSGNVPSPQEAGDKLKGKANEAGRKAQNAVGNTSQLPSPQDLADKAKDAVSGFGSGGGGGGAVGQNLQSKAGDIKDKAAQFPGASTAEGKGNAAGGPSEIADKMSEFKSKVKSNSTGDLSGLPSPQEAADKLKGKVDEVGRNVQGAGSNNPLSGNVPSPQEAGDKLKGKANEAGRKAQNAVGNTSQLPSPQDLADKAKDAVSGFGSGGGGGGAVGQNLQSKAGDIKDKAAQFPGASTAEGKGNAAGGPSEIADKMSEFKSKVKSNSTGDLSGLPSPQEAADKLKGKVDEVGRNVQGAGSNNPLSGNVPSPQEAGDKLKGKAKEAGRKAQNAVGNTSQLPSPQDLADKAKDAVSGFGSGGGGGGAVGQNLQSKAGDIKDKAAQFPGASTAEGKGNAAGGPSEIADKMSQLKSKVQSNSTGDLSGLPSPQEAADKLKGKVDEVGRNVQGAGSNNPLSGNVPSPQEAGDKLKGKANEAGRKAQNAVGNTSQLPSPQDLADKAKSAVSGGGGGGGAVGQNLQSKAGDIKDKAAQFPGASTAEGKGNAAGGPSEIADKMSQFKSKVQGNA